MSLAAIEAILEDEKNAAQAKQLSRFFKTGPGEYAEGDQFLGIKVPVLRKIAKHYYTMPLKDVKTLLCTAVHEKRFLALAILVLQYQRDVRAHYTIANFYLQHRKWINNWDLIDTSAPHIMGAYEYQCNYGDYDRRLRLGTYHLAHKASVWERRIAIISSFYFIRQNEFSHTMLLADMLLHDKHDLIHKAVDWMLREVGKRDFAVADTFVAQYYRYMPRTMLRYAIERFPENKRQFYMKK